MVWIRLFPSGAKPSAAKKRPQPQPEDDLPVWLAKLVDWFADLPKRLKTLPGRFVRLFDSWFYRIYFGVVAVALIAIFIGLHWLTGVVADYEIAQPSHVAEDVAKLFEDGNYDAIILVANWPEVRQSAWDILTRARAIENQCFVIAVNRVGDDHFGHYVGCSAAIDPIGRTLAQCRYDQQQALTVALDPAEVEWRRQKFRVLDDRD